MSEATDVLASRILIVDDQQSNLRLLEYTLRRGGYAAVESTCDPREVCALHHQHRYALILLDLQMPGMSGFEVIEALRSCEDPKAALLVLSADPSQRVRSLEAGAGGFLSKPFVLAEVLAQVRSLLENRVSGEIKDPRPRPEAPAPVVRPRLVA